ncbi:MAG: helix-turn-helix domain-containing protein [Armatimonadota bacterium]
MAEELLTVKEAARRLKMHPQTLRRWIRRGLLRASKVGPRQWRIREADLPTQPARPSSAELERRRKAVEGLLALREELRRRGVSAQELFRESRRELEQRHATSRD